MRILNKYLCAENNMNWICSRSSIVHFISFSSFALLHFEWIPNVDAFKIMLMVGHWFSEFVRSRLKAELLCVMLWKWKRGLWQLSLTPIACYSNTTINWKSLYPDMLKSSFKTHAILLSSFITTLQTAD